LNTNTHTVGMPLNQAITYLHLLLDFKASHIEPGEIGISHCHMEQITHGAMPAKLQPTRDKTQGIMRTIELIKSHTRDHLENIQIFKIFHKLWKIE